MDRVEPLPVIHAASAELGAQARPGWLVERLWAAEGVGVIGGAPKCCKTWLSLDLAVSVASGTDALGRFRVQAPGPVLVYGAEDAPVALRDRIETIARALASVWPSSTWR
jgi:RecA-family ATPase